MSQRIHLDATPGLFHQVLHCHQGDVGRQFEIAVVTRDGYEIPSGATFKIQATKPSGLGFTVTGTAANNIISFTSTEDMTSEAGEIPTQLEIKSGNDVIYTSNFLLVCEKNTHPASITDGSPEEIISEITLLVERAESAASTAGADAAAAAQARVDEMMNYLPTEVTNLKSDLSELSNIVIGENLFTQIYPTNFNNNNAITYNGDGSYTVGNTDYGVTTFGQSVTVPPGLYCLYGVEAGYSFLSTTNTTSGEFKKNQSSTPLWFYIDEEVTCYIGYRAITTPTTTFVITPYLREVGLQKDVADLKLIASTLPMDYFANDTAKATAITSGDLNDYTIVGNYKITASSIASSISNTPVNEAGRIAVVTTVNNNNLLQYYITNDGIIYYRKHNASGWSAWFYLANSNHLALLAPKASPTFTGVPTAPTASAGTSTTQIATTQFVASAVNALGKPIATDASAVAQISAGEDLNDYTTAGNYRISSSGIASQISNTPVNEGGRIVVMSVAGTTSQIQLYILNGGTIYYRSHNDSGWSAWGYFANNDHINSLLDSPTFMGTPKAPTATSGTSTTQIATTQFVTAAINALGVPIGTNAGSMAQIPANSDLNDYTTVGNYRVGTSTTAVTISHIPTNDAGRLIVSHLGGTSTLIQIYIANSARFFVRRYNASGWGAWLELVQNNAEYKGLFASIDRVNTASQGLYSFIKVLESMGIYNVRFANAPVPLGLQNYVEGYAGNTQNVHPKVLYFASKFGGHYYWMAYTPYPYGRSQYENPCIAYSDDGYSWTNIDDNPIDDPQGVGYNSDTHLVYRSDTSTLECWYRYVSDSEPRYETIYRQTSTDGVTWSTKETVLQSATSGATHYLSPAVEWDGSKYQIWVVDGTEIVYYEALPSNITTWTRIRSYSIPFTDGGESANPWHLDVIKDNGTYIMLVICMVSNSPRSKWSLFIATSADNISYSTPTKVVEGAPDSWDMYMYRSSIVKVGNSYRIYYSAMDSETVCGIGITESASLTNFIGKLVL